jgi:glycosyltransferase involved in cell wall biosynthesis
MRWVFRRADTLIVQNTEDVAALKKSLGLSAIVVRNACRIPASVCQDKSFILWVGRSAAFKKPRRFLELAQHFPQEEFVMICQQATADTNYDALRQEAGNIRNLKFIERVSFQDVDSYFERAKIYVNTSDSEGFPNTFVQACKAGTAILSYAVNPDAFLDTYHCGLCSHCDHNLLIRQLQTLLENDAYRNVGLHGLDYVKTFHDLSAIIEEYKTLFRSFACLERKHPEEMSG